MWKGVLSGGFGEPNQSRQTLQCSLLNRDHIRNDGHVAPKGASACVFKLTRAALHYGNRCHESARIFIKAGYGYSSCFLERLEPRREKSCLRDFRQGQTQTGLTITGDDHWLGISDLENRGMLLYK